MRGRGVSMWLLAAVLLRGAGAAEARQLAGRSFGEAGWNQAPAADSLALPVSFGPVDRGAFSFDLRRTGDIPLARAQTVFELVDDAGRTLLRVQVSWTTGTASGNPVLVIKGEGGGGEYHSHGLGLWGPYVELDRPVAIGETIHVDLTWDDPAGTCATFVDGREQPGPYGGFDPVQGRWYPDQRERINAEFGRRGKATPFDARPLGYFLSRVAAAHLGNRDTPRLTPTRPRTLLLQALLEDFAVFVDELPRPGRPPAIASLAHDAGRVAGFSGKLVAGDVLTVAVEGTPGAEGTFDVAHYPDLDRRIELDWRGWGVLLEDKPFLEEGEVDLRAVEGYRVYAATAPFDPQDPGFEPAATLGVKEQRHTLEGLAIDTPYYVAVVAALRDGTVRAVIAPVANRALSETAPGVYAGSYRMTPQDRYRRAVAVGRLRAGTAVVALAGDAGGAFAVDPGLNIAVTAEPSVLKADETSTAKVTVAVTDANGNAVPGHEIRFLLATTSQYTGVVGGGAFTDQVGGAIRTDLRGETDLFGRLTATYVAGFAAKTAVIVARDMTANSTGAGYVTTFIQAAAQLELEPPARTAATVAGYEISVTSSDAWLTADGKSQARITARVTRGGKPVEGHQVAFQIAAGTGTLRTVGGVTGASGEARAVYTAGVKIGLVLITATDTTVDLAGSVQIELRSDAPAKIAITTDPARLPADGRSRAELTVLVTDVNDNPSAGVEVEYAITEGDGSLEDAKGLTDRRGQSMNHFAAGRSPGRVSIEITVRSPAPSVEEVAKARELAVAVPDYEFF